MRTVSLSDRVVELPRVTRRQAVQWVMAAVAASALPGKGFDARGAQPQAAEGYGADPDLVKNYKPGDLWPLTFNDAQRKAAAALADVILPKDQYGAAASEVGVPEMLDEWISAPYPAQRADRPAILEGLAWLDAESVKRFGKEFARVSDEQKRAICDDICLVERAKPPFRKAADFFRLFRSLAAGAYYATPAGWKAIGYVGNVALPRFDGPPPDVLQKLGVAQTVPDAPAE